MIPSHRWFPRDIHSRAAWMQNFAAIFSQTALSLGFTEDDIATVNADSAALKWLSQNQLDSEAFLRAAAAFRIAATTGKSSANLGNFPAPPETTPPAKIDPGIYERLDHYVRRIRLAKNYSESIGSQMAIIPAKPAALNLNAAHPKAGLLAVPGNVVRVSFVRGQATGVMVEIKLDNEESWRNMGRFARSPFDLDIERGPEDLPRLVRVRLRFISGNDPVGEYSEVDSISTIP